MDIKKLKTISEEMVKLLSGLNYGDIEHIVKYYLPEAIKERISAVIMKD